MGSIQYCVVHIYDHLGFVLDWIDRISMLQVSKDQEYKCDGSKGSQNDEEYQAIRIQSQMGQLLVTLQGIQRQ